MGVAAASTLPGSIYGTLRQTTAPLLGGTPFVDSAELALILGEPHTTVHRALIGACWPTTSSGG